MARFPRDSEAEAARREDAFRALLPFTRDRRDPVERWKEMALRRVARPGGAAARPRVDIRIGLGFIVMGLLAGQLSTSGGPAVALLGLVLVTLGDELPGAWLLRAWGRSSAIVLGAGGAATETFGCKLSRGQMLFGALAGPITNVALGASLLVVCWRVGGLEAEYARRLAYWQLAWGAAQAIPLLPLRAGRLLAAKLRSPFRAVLTAFSVKLLFLGGLVLSRLVPFAFPLVILALAAAVREFVALYLASSDEKSGAPGDARLAERLLDAGERLDAMKVARRALARARSGPLRARLWRVLAWAAIGEGDPFLAHGALGALPVQELELHLVAAYLTSCNRLDEAATLLENARALGHRARETTKLLLELSLRRGDFERGRAIAREDAGWLSSEDRRLVEGSPLGATGGAYPASPVQSSAAE